VAVQDFDPIDLEVLRSRLESIGDQACRAVEQTAISPNVTEAKDYSVTLLDARGALIIGSGPVIYHYGAAVNAVRSTIARYGDGVAAGDVFLANDPHNGGGLHPADVMVQQPIFSGARLIAWVAVSAHLMDMGGMVIGSFAPDATECYQEGFRVPPVRLFRRGEEVADVWALLRTNVRMAELVEMDMRALVAGAHFATERLREVVEQSGVALFIAGLAAIRDLTEAEFRRRIGEIADGEYRSTSWVEYRREFHKIPCTLTVAGDQLIFDFAGAAPQTTHFFNSRPYIVAAELIVMIANLLAADLPFNDGMFAPVTIRCPEGSIIDARPPAPISASHMHASFNAAGTAMEALMLALAASPDAPRHRFLTGAPWESSLGNQLWYWDTDTGEQDAYLAQEGNWAGSSAGIARDGNDLGRSVVGPEVGGSFPDVEVLESWYPLLFIERGVRGGSGGAGQMRAGGGFQVSFRPHGVDEIRGTMFGMRRWLPLQGLAGGRPGACNEFLIHRADGSIEALDMISAGAKVREGEWFELRMGSGGGYGDPLDRAPDEVARDVAHGRFDAAVAHDAYGVVLGDADATERLRARMRRDRLSRARPAAKPLARDDVMPRGKPRPLFPGIVQDGDIAIAEASGAPLARAPDHWTEGCPVLIEPLYDNEKPGVIHRSWLDPETGRSLHVEAVLAEDPERFLVAPRRWVDAASA
jgi:N-methylhydantoinase B